ncbi:lysylphosphatidylglycerol synthase transmembrane domain-containing protein [Saccharopolyspora mangrovi]|uniref:Lysylphosphatidylglycerol synthase transmembrane domain-containing protein n=1 Tax=Saccharopolyspora mangrovi TaxID=3082379 RepID=A0ABU6AJX1_9PSEU|nr:lysylphosphatidylglycerol synthase transmembrane domain-containing protein [Saccharopolyspora sp. S2-29]MEB3371825.1 lysylphosphatidylglycerol synthase transmembrane domain-containing protein [Saccharopolyspora sp. S2-29]
MIRHAWPWLRALAAVGILAVLAWRLGANAFLEGLRAIGPWTILTALGIGLATTACSAWRWSVVARGLGLRLPLRTALADYYRALLLNAVLPAGVLGDVHRAVSHGHRSGDLGGGVRAVVLERFAGQIALLAVAGIVLVTGPVLPFQLGPGLLVAALVGGACLLVPAVRRAAATFWRDARRGVLTRRALTPVAVSSVATVAGHLALFLVAARVSGVTAPIAALLPLLVLALLVMALPLNIGGFGPREAFLAIAFAATGLDPAQGLATSVAYGALTLIAALPGVFALVGRSARRSRAVERRERVLAG